MAVIVTVTRPGVTVTATSTSSASSNVSAGAIAGIVIGTLVGGILLITLVLYFLNRYSRPKFTKVVNPAHDPISPTGNLTDMQYLPKRMSSIKSNSRHLQWPSISSDPLIPVSLPPLSPSSPHARSPGTPPRSIISATSHSPMTATPDIPLHERTSPASLRLGWSDTSPDVAQSSLDDARIASQNMFIHRMLQSRAKASEEAALSRRSSLGASQSRSTTPSNRPDQERLLAEAERMALRDAEMAQRVIARAKMLTIDDDLESMESSYSQVSAPADHSLFFSESVSGQSGLSLPRRKSSRRRRPPAVELPPVAEVSDVPSSFEGRSQFQPILTAANPSADVQVPHGTGSCPMSSVLDLSGPMPLLTSVNFGKDSTTSGTPPGSISSTTGWASSSGRASRYPSLAASSAGQSSRSGPRSDGGTDWHHPPSGLAGLATLQIGSLTNPHSPVEEHPEEREAAPVEVGQVRRARLREGTSSSIPEVERRSVMQGGIVRIDVTL